MERSHTTGVDGPKMVDRTVPPFMADMKRYICANCGYVYDPEKGDPMNGIPPGTAFEDLPEAWVCPMCYAAKSQFDELD